MESILLLGGGGHCKSVLDSLVKLNRYDRIGIVLNEIDESVNKLAPVVGCDDDLIKLFNAGWDSAFVAVGSIGNTHLRKKLYFDLTNIGFRLPSIVDPSSVLASHVKLGPGCYIGKNAVINEDSTIAECAIINTGAIIEHDCSIDKFVHVAPGTVLCGNVKVGAYSHIGAGSVVKQGLNIGSKTLIGIGSVVTHSIADNLIAYGNPCREITNQ